MAWSRSGRVRRRPAIVGLTALVCGLMGACGGDTPSAPATPAPTPPAPVPAGFLHVLQADSVFTYAIDDATGRLRESARQSVGDAHTLAGEPQGRYVYAAYGPRSARPPYDEPHPSIVAYTPDPLTGSLAMLSEASSDPVWRSSMAVTCAWHWLSATSTRVYATWQTITYHDVYTTYVTHAVGGDGRLGAAYQQTLDEWDPEDVAVDDAGDTDALYKGTWRGGLTAHSVEADGRLKQLGASDLCLASRLGPAEPLAAVRGFVFAYGPVGYDRTTCSWEGPRLAPRANLGLRSDYAVALAPRGGASSSSPASTRTLVAMRMDTSATGPYEVRLFAMSDDGALQMLDATTGPGWARHLLLHPSGRFLYLSLAPSRGSFSLDSLLVCSIDAQGHLGEVETLAGGGGTMAVTMPPQVRARAGPGAD